MCYIWRNAEEPKNDITIKEWKQLIQSLDGFLDKKHDIIFSGGEPLLKEGIMDLISFGSKAGYKISLDTNGYLIDEDMAKALGDSGLWRICISLDSTVAAVHDSLRGRVGSYDRVMRAIEYLHTSSPQVGINIQTVINAMNLDTVIALADFVQNDHRLEYIYFQAVVLPFGAQQDNVWYKKQEYGALWPSDPLKVRHVLNALANRKKSASKIVNTVTHLESFKSYFEYPDSFFIDTKCTIGNRAFNVNTQGDVFLCFSQETLGNIKANTIRDLWNSNHAAAVRERIASCRKNCHFLLNCSYE